jgi:ketosteroid isomerase-like protein
MTVKLPEPLGEYFAAANTDDSARVGACFAPDALVHDEGADRQGREAIRAWAEESRRKYHFQAEVLTAAAATDLTIVTAHVTGDFPGSPVDLTYRFKLADGLIAALEIG